MKRSRLVLSTSYFGTSRLLGEEVSRLAAQVRADDIALGPSLDPGDPKRFRAEFTARHLGVVAAENVWASAQVEERHREGRALCSPDARERELAIRLSIQSGENLRRAGGEVLIVRLGNCGEIRDRELIALEERHRSGESVEEEMEVMAKKAALARVSTMDRVCRSLHALLKGTQEVRVGLLTGDPVVGALSPETFDWIREDLGSKRLGYWHDPVVAKRWERLGAHDPGTWLNHCASFMAGVFLHDALDGEGRLPPGLGEIDLSGLQDYVPEEAHRVVWVDGKGGLSSLMMAFNHLRDMGFE